MKDGNNDYIIHRNQRIGKGANGQVYLCHRKDHPQQLYACKIMKITEGAINSLKALQHEFIIQRKINHPNVVRVFEDFVRDGEYCIVQEYCKDGTLKNLLKDNGRFTQEQVRAYAQQICLGFSALMENGIIHRDLKPANIFAHEGALKIGDFGLSRFIRSQQQLLRSFLGSNGYMSPQISNNSPDTPYSAKCDVWSFGVIVFEMLMGKRLEQCTLEESQQINQQFQDLIVNCLENQETDRFSWMEVFQHKVFPPDSQIFKIGQQMKISKQVGLSLLEQVKKDSKKMNAPYLIEMFLRTELIYIDFAYFLRLAKKLIPQATKLQVSFIFEVFDQDHNGIVDIEEFVLTFQVKCHKKVLKMLKRLLGQKFTFQNFTEGDFFLNTVYSMDFDDDIIQKTKDIIDKIKAKPAFPNGLQLQQLMPSYLQLQ